LAAAAAAAVLETSTVQPAAAGPERFSPHPMVLKLLPQELLP
jgi:hypothetical protein